MPINVTLDWARLKSQGRCKDICVPWNEEELKARKLDIPADYVRIGILTLQEYKARKEADDKLPSEKVLIRKSEKELLHLALEAGSQVTPNASKEVLIDEIETLRKKKEKPKVEKKEESNKLTKPVKKADK